MHANRDLPWGAAAMRVWLLALLLTGPALGGGAENKAEAHRLSQEMTKLAERNAWSGVARAYAALVAVPGVEVDVDQHLLGAHASQSAGDVNSMWQCLNNAVEAAPLHEDALMWRATLMATYGEVDLKIHKAWENEIALLGVDIGFNPEHRRVFESAQKALDEDRGYTGLLPLGRYQLGHEKFDIIGGPLVKVTLKPPK